MSIIIGECNTLPIKSINPDDYGWISDVRTGERKEFESLDHAKWFLFNIGIMPYELDQFWFWDTEAEEFVE